ncbi:MAG TPA: hypothetical protein VJ583_08530 [Nitrososphaeraceae archaeon]|nr:hypothetical protein [Nitrososphaeraceae archaeon]
MEDIVNSFAERLGIPPNAAKKYFNNMSAFSSIREIIPPYSYQYLSR